MTRFSIPDDEVAQLMAPLREHPVRIKYVLDMLAMYLKGGHIFTAFTLRLSVPFRPAPLPASVRRGPLRECYRNAAELAMWKSDLTYVEGYAYSGVLPIEHAWCVDQQGNVVDPTWDNPQSCEYLGIPFDKEFLMDSLIDQKVYGILGGPRPYQGFCKPLEEVISPSWYREISSREPLPSVEKMLASIRAREPARFD